MNERIKEIEKQCWKSSQSEPYALLDVKKFAELIIREYSYDVMDLTAAPEHVAMAARHWGVEL